MQGAARVLNPSAVGTVQPGGARPGPQAAAAQRLLWRMLPVLSVLGFLLLWAILAVMTANHALLPSPLEVGHSLIDKAVAGDLWRDTKASLGRLILSFAVAMAIGAPLGVLIAISRWVSDSVEPIIELIRPVSGIAWIPFGLFIFGISESLPIFIMTYVAIFPIVLNTTSACKMVRRDLLSAAQVLGLSRTAVIIRVMLPAALSGVITGARLGAGGAWLALVAAEFIGSPNGLGFSIWYYAGIVQTSDMMAYIVATGVGGFLTDRVLRLIHRRLTPWSANLRSS